MVPVLLQAIKEQQREIEQQKAAFDKQQADIAELKKAIQKLINK